MHWLLTSNNRSVYAILAEKQPSVRENPTYDVDKSESVSERYSNILADNYEIQQGYYGDQAVADFINAWVRPTEKDSS